MREDKINKSGSWHGSSERPRIFHQCSREELAGSNSGVANSAPESQTTARGKWTRRTMVSFLIGSLLLALAMVVAPSKSSASVSIFVSFGPPAIPVYVQPACPGLGYMWTPGYWAWDPDYGYYWVPGTWVMAPFVGALWTPGYWGWYNGGYMWYPGYWGTAVGFYGGIDYGFGYTGRGYYGGYWRGDRFFYNREVNRITNVNIVNVYSQRVDVNERGPRISYNGGRGGIEARPTSAELAAERGRRFGAINQQVEQDRWARTDRAQWARENRGRPGIAATARPGEFRGSGAVRATRAGAPYNEPPHEVRGGRQVGRPAPAPVERGPVRNAPQEATPNRQVARGGPVQPRYERPANRSNAPATVQRNPRESRPPEAARPEGRGGQERQGHPQNQRQHEGGNNKNPGHEQK